MVQVEHRLQLDQQLIRVLIVDDHELVREGLRSILAGEPDLDVVGEAASADDLLHLVEQTDPAVVLLDARLPGMSGPDACRLLTHHHPELEVLIVSSYTDDELVRRCIEAGASGYVIKDIERFELIQAIRAVSRGEGVVSQAVAGKILDHLRVPSVTPGLNDPQLRILKLITEGYSNREIASHVHLSENTVKSHVQEIFRKLKVRNRVEAALRAAREGWV
jgi:two-component system, NarL family, response regulator DevR